MKARRGVTSLEGLAQVSEFLFIVSTRGTSSGPQIYSGGYSYLGRRQSQLVFDCVVENQ